MAGVKPMNEKDANMYLEQVKRMAAFKNLPVEVQSTEDSQREYNRLVNYLKKGYQPYVIYVITGGRNKANIELYNKAIKRAEEKGIFSEIFAAIKKGDVKKVEWHVWRVKGEYINALMEKKKNI